MEQGVLRGSAIQRAVEAGDIEVDPFNPEHINPASIDLLLGPKIAVYERWVKEYDSGIGSPPQFPFYRDDKVLDVKVKPHVRTYDIGEGGFVLQPQILYLMHTVERVTTKKYEPIIEGKSSIGRLGIFVHITAGYGDPGFNGQYTLEVLAVHPVRIYAGMRICQMRFMTLVGEETDYQKTGNYVGELAQGPVPSQAYKQFKR
jgi:dCTP deaminase